MKILIIEDEILLLESIADYLAEFGFLCEKANDFNEASEKIELYDYDVIILDLTLPGGNGMDLLSQLVKIKPETGVLILTARNSLDDKLRGLDHGADDYLTKPFHLAELNSRVKAIIRRRQFHGQEKLSWEEFEIDLDCKEVYLHDVKVEISKKEYEMLLYFVVNPNRVISKEALAEHLWGDHFDEADNFDFIYAHMKNLRRKIKKAGGKNYFQTVYGLGYRLTSL